MPNKKEANSPLAAALRNAGFVPLPRLWVKAKDLDIIKAYAKKYEKEVNDIRSSIKGPPQSELEIQRATTRRAVKRSQALPQSEPKSQETDSEDDAEYDPLEVDWPGMN